MRPANPAGGIWGRQAYPAPRSSAGAGGRCCVLRDDALGAGRDALARGDADLDGLLDAVRDGGDALGRGLGDGRQALRHEVLATVGAALDLAGLALEGAAVAADEALDARAGELGLALAAALEATDVLLELALAAAQGLLRVGHGAVLVDDAGGDADDAVAGLEDAADVHQRGALGDVAALLGRDLGSLGVGRGGLRGGASRLVLRAGARALRGGARRGLGGR